MAPVTLVLSQGVKVLDDYVVMPLTEEPHFDTSWPAACSRKEYHDHHVSRAWPLVAVTYLESEIFSAFPIGSKHVLSA